MAASVETGIKVAGSRRPTPDDATLNQAAP